MAMGSGSRENWSYKKDKPHLKCETIGNQFQGRFCLKGGRRPRLRKDTPEHKKGAGEEGKNKSPLLESPWKNSLGSLGRELGQAELG